MDREVTKVGRYMSDFFKVLKKTANQDIRDFNQEFDRQISRLREVGCTLPDNCLAWWYVDKMRLDNATELNLLSSVGNLYNLQKLQDAAIIQDRMNRRLWERRPDGDKRTEEKRKGHQALMTSLDDDDEDNEEPGLSDIEEEEFIDDEHTHEAFVAFRNAKSKYRAALKERGYTQSKDERLQQAKARSYCSVCHKKGHWHKDPECPANKGKQGGEAHTTHVVYITQNAGTKNDIEEYQNGAEHYVGNCADSIEDTDYFVSFVELQRNNVTTDRNNDLVWTCYAVDSNVEKKAPEAMFLAITDCACSRTLAGRSWAMNFIGYLKKTNIPYFIMKQEETFKFGGERLYPSRQALVTWLAIQNSWFAVKISVVGADVPLLLSRPALGALGMRYDIAQGVADFPIYMCTQCA